MESTADVFTGRDLVPCPLAPGCGIVAAGCWDTSRAGEVVMAEATDESIAGYGRRAAPVPQALGHGRAATADRNAKWDSPPGGTGG